ncbi:hypothetical protein FM076_33105 [Streptomyces albus subsp. chlorinus]|uniref:hypothetical protein n=1 Tax=Streptomyces albus TaxID=1888 RepID=UPI00156F9B52|nr:hypothetical protein [Streptomyces albus]NSC25725.1 hypothetical protein [Streptomyces albus subsp. chlorinus]
MPVRRTQDERYPDGYHEPRTLIGYVENPYMALDGSWAFFTLVVPREGEPIEDPMLEHLPDERRDHEIVRDRYTVSVPEQQIEEFSKLFPKRSEYTSRRNKKMYRLNHRPYRVVRVPFVTLRAAGKAGGDDTGIKVVTRKIDFDAPKDAFMAVRKAEAA